ncbi:MAG TPA: hypothetical protein VEU72_03750 [Nitrosopumilaceae archaeon]|nr:hypothetical protein [Nitrosopumilaceae archaeon]
MRYIALVIMVFLLANLIPAFGIYDLPTKREQDLYNQLLAEFTKLNIQKKNVSDVLSTFDKPLVVTFPCNSTDTNNLVVNVIKTRLARFDETQAHQGDLITGGTYTWQCQITTQEGKVTNDCNNDLRLNPDLLTNGTGIDPRVHQVENLVILYHELLHGQLMIDAIKSSDKWKQDVCNKSPDGNIDYSYADGSHKIINPLQEQFAEKLVENEGGKLIISQIYPSETFNGTFSLNVLSQQDYQQYVNGIRISLRGTNMADPIFSSSDTNVTLTGHLVNNTKPGIAWFYIFENQNQTSNAEVKILPAWLKRTASLWSHQYIPNSDFHKVIEFFIQEGMVSDTGKNSSSKIPEWFKNNAEWWYEGLIDDNTFTNEIQYLLSIGVIS